MPARRSPLRRRPASMHREQLRQAPRVLERSADGDVRSDVSERSGEEQDADEGKQAGAEEPAAGAEAVAAGGVEEAGRRQTQAEAGQETIPNRAPPHQQ